MRRALLQIAHAAARVRPAGVACATEATSEPAAIDVEGDGLDPSGDLDEEIDEPIAPDTGLDGDEAPTSDQVVEAALTDVNGFWQRTYEDLYGTPYEPISGGFWPYGPDTEQPPCGHPAPTYSDIAENAFYCPGADLIAWDDATLIPELYDEFGGFTIGIVFAHEFGHAIQARAGTTGDATVRAGAPGRLLRRRVGPRRGGGQLGVLRAHPRRPRQGGRRLPRAARRRRHRRRAIPPPTAPASTASARSSTATSSGVEHCAGYPDAARRPATWSSSRCPSPAPGRLRAGWQPPARPSCVPSLLEDLENFWTILFEEEGLEWTPVADVVPIDPDAAEVRLRRRDLLGRRARERGPSTASTTTRSTSTTSTSIPALNEIGDYAVATEIARAVRLRRPGAPRDRGEHPRHQPQRRLPHRRLRVERLPRRPAGPGPGAVPLPRRPRRGRDRVPPQQRCQRGRRGRRRVRGHRLPALRRLPRRLPVRHPGLRRPPRRGLAVSRAAWRARRDWRTTIATTPPIATTTSPSTASCERAASVTGLVRRRPRCSAAARCPGSAPVGATSSWCPVPARSPARRCRASASNPARISLTGGAGVGTRAVGPPGRRRACALRRCPTTTGPPRCADVRGPRRGWPDR